jgi:hypothetical protein
MMADVHRARLGAHEPPFTYTSVDYFGPIEVVHGRGSAKRWGVLLTCLVTRAVYVVVAISLSADDFLLVLRRFASIYRKPAFMFSNNGTNLVGAERILREELERLQGDEELVIQLKGLGINGSNNLALLEENSLISEPEAEKSSGENGAAKSGTKIDV